MDIKKARKILLKNEEFKREYEKIDLALEISKMIIEARNLKGLTQKKLADLINTKQSSIARVEKGEHLPDLSFLIKIANGLETQLLPPRFAFMVEHEYDSFSNSYQKTYYITYDPFYLNRPKIQISDSSNKNYTNILGEYNYG